MSGGESVDPWPREIAAEAPVGARDDVSGLRLLDEHEVVVAAAAADVWPVLLDTVDRAFTRPGMAAYAGAVGSVDPTATGPRPLAEGSTLPGFRVVSLLPSAALVLVGRHRFSSYALTLRLTDDFPGTSRLRAESRAEFPGLLGGAYRLLVVRTGAHVIAVRRLLTGIKRRAEADRTTS